MKSDKAVVEARRLFEGLWFGGLSRTEATLGNHVVKGLTRREVARSDCRLGFAGTMSSNFNHLLLPVGKREFSIIE